MIANCMSIKQILEYILENPETANYKVNRTNRPSLVTMALKAAVKVLPEGRSKRALAYVANNPGAELHFGGTDAVGPAIKEAIGLMQ
jgi:hypothetical protein